jgi:hypothetical protein
LKQRSKNVDVRLFPQIPFSLTLRVWDLYLLEGERVMIAMAYNILRMHRRYLAKLQMDEIIEHLQVTEDKLIRQRHRHQGSRRGMGENTLEAKASCTKVYKGVHDQTWHGLLEMARRIGSLPGRTTYLVTRETT